MNRNALARPLLAVFFLQLISLCSFGQVLMPDTLPFLPEHYRKRVAMFNTEPATSGSIVMLGNSITEGGRWQQLFPEKTILNRGIGGDITFGILHRLDEVTARKPSQVFLLIGINDIAKGVAPEVIASNCKRIITRIKEVSPSTRIYLQSILPVNPGIAGFPARYNQRAKILTCNQLLSQVSRELQVVYIDLHSHFVDSNGLLDQTYTYDGLHLSEDGYRQWATVIGDFVRK